MKGFLLLSSYITHCQVNDKFDPHFYEFRVIPNFGDFIYPVSVSQECLVCVSSNFHANIYACM